MNVKWIIRCFKHFFDCKGRAPLAEFSSFLLFGVAVNVVFWLLLIVSFYISVVFPRFFLIVLFGWIAVFFALQVGMLSVSVRRLHDTGRSGKLAVVFFCLIMVWLALVIYGIATFKIFTDQPMTESEKMIGSFLEYFYPLLFGATAIMGVTMLYLGFSEGQKGENKYGPDPERNLDEKSNVKS